MARSYVDSILDAAAMASRQDTLGDMLNQLPGLLMEQERYRDQQQREDDRYAEELTFRNKQYQDTVDARNLAADIELINIGTDLEGESGLAYFDNVSFSTEKGRNLGSALRNSKNINVTSNNTINENIKTFSTGLAQMDYEDARKGLDAINLDLESKGIKRDLSSLEKQVAVKQGREFANDVLSVVDFENEDDLRNIISGSNNPAQIVEFMVNRLDKDKLDSIKNKKDKEELFIKYGNMYSTLLNSGAPESQLSNISNRMTTLQLEIDGDEVSEPSLSERPLTEADKKLLGPGEERIVEDGGIRYLFSNKTGTVKIVADDFKLESDSEKLEKLKKERKNVKTKEELDKVDKEISELEKSRGKRIQENLKEQSFLEGRGATLPFDDVLGYSF
tara:strand:- start:253 stop:1425 length:1173 start_codon:yes stop_codon:yes gene_type:complete